MGHQRGIRWMSGAVVAAPLALGVAACGGKTQQGFECLDCTAEAEGAHENPAPVDVPSATSQKEPTSPELDSTEPAEDEYLGDDPGRVRDPVQVTDEPSDDPDLGPPDDPCTTAPSFELVQEIPLSEYGRNSNTFQLSPDGRELVLFEEQYDRNDQLRALDLTNGTTANVAWHLSTYDWQLQVHRAEESLVISRAGEALWEKSIDQLVDFDLAFSDDGQVLIFAACPDGSLTVERHEATSGELLTEVHTGFDCIYSQPMASISEASTTTILRLNAVETGFFRLLEDDLIPIQPDELPPLSTTTEIGLAPDGTRMVVGYPGSDSEVDDQRLALVSLLDGSLLASNLRSQLTSAYTFIYAEPLNTLPIRWAPDGSYFVVPDAGGDLQVLSACDGGTLTTLAAPGASPDYIGWDGDDEGPNRDTRGPSNLAFDADGDRLVAYFAGRGVQVYDVIGPSN